jgi:AraC-like DNA-binding protein
MLQKLTVKCLRRNRSINPTSYWWGFAFYNSQAARAEVSHAHFRRIFEDAMGMPPHCYVLSVRLEQARKLLCMSSMSIARIAQESGLST